MTEEEILKSLKAMISSALKIQISGVRKDSNLQDDLGIDSVDFMDLLVKVNTQFNIKLSVKEVANLTTLNDLVQLIRKSINHDR